jgi:hypothetical protein
MGKIWDHAHGIELIITVANLFASSGVSYVDANTRSVMVDACNFE